MIVLFIVLALIVSAVIIIYARDMDGRRQRKFLFVAEAASKASMEMADTATDFQKLSMEVGRIRQEKLRQQEEAKRLQDEAQKVSNRERKRSIKELMELAE